MILNCHLYFKTTKTQKYGTYNNMYFDSGLYNYGKRCKTTYEESKEY